MTTLIERKHIKYTCINLVWFARDVVLSLIKKKTYN